MYAVVWIVNRYSERVVPLIAELESIDELFPVKSKGEGGSQSGKPHTRVIPFD